MKVTDNICRYSGIPEQADEELVHHPPSLRALHHPQREETAWRS